MSHKHELNVFTPDFKINAVSREVIQVQPDVLITLMQYDHNSEKLRFECPRYIDGHDMSKCNKVEVHFVNSDVAGGTSKGGYYTVTDLGVNSSDPSLVNFSWVVSRNSTENVGTLVFSVRFICTTGDVIDYVWHTLPFTYVSVDQGLVNELDPEYQKVYLDNLETEAAKKVVAAGNATTTALEAAERASEAVNDLYSMDVTDKAPAIVCEASGEVISITDSANMPLKGLRLFGKSVQDGTPTPDAPVEIESVESPTVNITDGTDDNVQNIVIGKTLCGIPVISGGNYTDENGQQWICDEVDLERGVYVKRIGTRALTGTDTFKDYISGSGVVTVSLPHLDKTPFFCSHFIVDDTAYWANSGAIAFSVAAAGIATVDDFRLWVAKQDTDGTPVTVVYALATSIETPLSETEIAAYKALHTNKPNTIIFNDSGAWQSVDYVADTKLYIDNKLAELVGK